MSSNEAVVADGVMTMREAVEFTKLSRAEIYRLMNTGRLVYVKHGKRRLVPRRSLVALLAGQVVEGPTAPRVSAGR